MYRYTVFECGCMVPQFGQRHCVKKKSLRLKKILHCGALINPCLLSACIDIIHQLEGLLFFYYCTKSYCEDDNRQYQ